MSWQREVIQKRKKNNILRVGRRSGKTELIVRLSIVDALLVPKQKIAVVLPNYNQAKNVFFKRIEEVKHHSWDLRSGDSLQCRFPNGSIIYIFSGDNPDSLRGYGFNSAYLDEAAILVSDLWSKVVSPTLLTTNGSAFICSTPKGMNWFFGLWQTNKDKSDWGLFHYSTYVSELVKKEWIDQQKESMTEEEFREELLAEFVSSAGSVFRGIIECATVLAPDLPEKHKEHSKVMGVDWGRSHDYTAITVMCTDCKRVVDWDRYNKIDFSFQRDKLKAINSKWNCSYILAESNSIGQPNIEVLQNEGISVYGFQMTAESKPKVIRQLVLDLEKNQIQVPAEYIGELQAYEAKVTSSGYAKYNAPQGMYDDRVISLALANRARIINGGWGGIIKLE